MGQGLPGLFQGSNFGQGLFGGYGYGLGFSPFGQINAFQYGLGLSSNFNSSPWNTLSSVSSASYPQFPVSSNIGGFGYPGIGPYNSINSGSNYPFSYTSATTSLFPNINSFGFNNRVKVF